jgi:hypothetical protein
MIDDREGDDLIRKALEAEDALLRDMAELGAPAPRREADAYRAGLEAAAEWHDDQYGLMLAASESLYTEGAQDEADAICEWHRSSAAAIRAMKGTSRDRGKMVKPKPGDLCGGYATEGGSDD